MTTAQCPGCASPLNDDGTINMPALDQLEQAADIAGNNYNATLAELADVEAAAARATAARDSALDEDQRLRWQLRLKPLAGRLEQLRALAATHTIPHTPNTSDGECSGCGVHLRAGRVDRRWLAQHNEQRANLARYLAALREEHAAAEHGLRTVDRNLTWNDAFGPTRPAAVIERELAERRERKQSHLDGVTAQIVTVEAALRDLEIRPRITSGSKPRRDNVRAYTSTSSRPGAETR